MRYITTIEGREFEVEIQDENHVIVDGITYEINFDSIGDQPMYSLLVNGHSFEAYVYPAENLWQVLLLGRSFPAHVEDERERRLRNAAGSTISQRTDYCLRAPMPGLIVDVPVTEGQEVNAGDVLVILESMKMQNELKSPRPGKIGQLSIQVGDSVEHKQALLNIV